MKLLLTISLFLSLIAQAQEETLDPSIFDGSGKELEKSEPQDSSAGSPEAPPETGEGAETEPSPAEVEQGSTPMDTDETEEAPREIVLPEIESGEAEDESEEEPGIPAAQGGSKSRAGETVDSTEKIAPGQAVDFPWDM